MMNGSSKVIMAATMVMVVSLVTVLSLVLVLLAELYCSLLLSRRRHHSITLPTITVDVVATNEPSPSSPNPLNTGVLQTPRTFLQTKTHFHHESSSSIPPNQIREIKNPIANNDPNHDKPVAFVDNFVYISNPIYSNEATSKPTTPFETPQSSPSRLETTDSDEEYNDITEEDSTLTLTPMKDLPEKACSVSLKHVKSLETCGSESNSNNNNGGSSSSSCSPYTSPSW